MAVLQKHKERLRLYNSSDWLPYDLDSILIYDISTILSKTTSQINEWFNELSAQKIDITSRQRMHTIWVGITIFIYENIIFYSCIREVLTDVRIRYLSGTIVAILHEFVILYIEGHQCILSSVSSHKCVTTYFYITIRATTSLIQITPSPLGPVKVLIARL